MKLRNSGIVIISLLILLCLCFTATATSISDGTGDVWHWAQALSGTGWAWQESVEGKPNIDIKEISYMVSENKITFSLKVLGTIQTSDKVFYYITYNSTDTYYYFSYSNGSVNGFGIIDTNYTSAENFTISGNTLSVYFDVLGDTSKLELWGYATEYTAIGDQNAEWWGDWAPNEQAPYYTESDDSDDSNDTDGTVRTSNEDGASSETRTPGFEVILVTAAVAIALIFLRKRR